MLSRYRFCVQIRDETRAAVHQEEVSDFLPCYEDLLFTAVCARQLPNDGQFPPAFVEPLWREGEEGRVTGVVVSVPPLCKQYGLAIFTDTVWATLVNRQLIKGDEQAGEGETRQFTWWVEVQERAEERKGKWRISRSRAPYPLIQGNLATFGVESVPGDTRPFSLFLSRSLRDALLGESAHSLDTERADILTGHLVQEATGQVALVVTGHMPVVTETVSSRIHFAFSPLSFVAVQREVAQRGETIVGWHHNHPPPCGGACLQYLPSCKTTTLFLSPADRAVHRASFPAAYMIALVSGKEAGRRANDPGLQAYGWQDGVIQQRAFSVF